jgi:gluconate kinase
MIIFIGGLPGTGKSSVARCLAEKLSINYYDVDEVKKVIGPQDPDFDYNMKHGIPFTEEMRLKVFKKVVEDFESLSKSNRHLLVDESLHLKKSRQVLFDGAKAHFGGYVIVWVKTDEQIVEERLTSKKRTGHILITDAMKMYRSFAKEFEPFEGSYIVCENNGSIGETTEKLYYLIQNLASLKI